MEIWKALCREVEIGAGAVTPCTRICGLYCGTSWQLDMYPFLHVPWKSQFSHVSGRCEAEAVCGSGGLGARVWRRRQNLLLAPCQRGAARPADRPLRRPQVSQSSHQEVSLNLPMQQRQTIRTFRYEMNNLYFTKTLHRQWIPMVFWSLTV